MQSACSLHPISSGAPDTQFILLSFTSSLLKSRLNTGQWYYEVEILSPGKLIVGYGKAPDLVVFTKSGGVRAYFSE